LKVFDAVAGRKEADALPLMQAVLADPDPEAARSVLAEAKRLGVDPLDFVVHRRAIAATDVYARAAQWAGLAHFPTVALGPEAGIEMKRLDALADVRMIRATIFDREISYTAPDFDAFLALRRHAQGTPELGDKLCVVPPAALRRALTKASSAALLDEARGRLAHRWPDASAKFELTMPARLAFLAGLVVLVGLVASASFLLRPLALALLWLVLVVPALFRLLAAVLPRPAEPSPPPPADADLPVYSVLLPLRDEANMVPLLHEAVAALDYPPEKLDIKFVVETASASTIAAVEAVLADPRCDLVIVPEAEPLTKPKALDYALPGVRGAFVVVYDAEDIPEPDQLRRAAARFLADPGLDCLQAELVIDNAAENGLTALFSGEYAGQFGLVLPLLSRWRLPVPLGGTSNHFRTQSLRELGGWDAFNVTEDADLGVRLARLRYRTGTFSSQTGEEAPIRLASWMAQRTRWFKGWMQTFIVHNRSPRAFLADIGWKGFLAFQLYVGSMMLSALLHTVFMLGLLAGVITGLSAFRLDDGWDVAMLAVPAIGYGGAFILVVAGLLRIGQGRLLVWQLLLPLYWMLHSVAVVRAAHELLTRPYFWAKTSHGQSRLRQERQEPPGQPPQ
jgi:cellulose synthase/poly-beta-1,6-N-acetylglucosamine synthase-like glycosyltransferase